MLVCMYVQSTRAFGNTLLWYTACNVAMFAVLISCLQLMKELDFGHITHCMRQACNGHIMH